MHAYIAVGVRNLGDENLEENIAMKYSRLYISWFPYFRVQELDGYIERKIDIEKKIKSEI